MLMPRKQYTKEFKARSAAPRIMDVPGLPPRVGASSIRHTSSGAGEQNRIPHAWIWALSGAEGE